MEILEKGQRLQLSTLAPNGVFQVGLAAKGLPLDFACFGIDESGMLSDERYMTFFNQPASPCGGVALSPSAGDQSGFAFQLHSLPSSIERLVITASIESSGSMSQLQSGYLRLLDGTREAARFSFHGRDFDAEKAVMLGEIYRRDGNWRFMVVGQGFIGGLDALVAYFGATVANAPKPALQAPTQTSQHSASRVSFEKRVEREAPQLVSLVKQAAVSLEKVGLSDHRAKVCLCLDISGSMHSLYKKGLVQKFAERVLALGCKFDDDGEIDVFLFGEEVHQPTPMGLANCGNYVNQITMRYPLEGDTRYGYAMKEIRSFYYPDAQGGERRTPLKSDVPVYVMFVTDGSTSDKGLTEKQLRWSSMEPIFWQFMGIGKGRKSKSKLLSAFAGSDFPFLEKLDELSGRLIDNANFFAVESPDEHSDSALYDLLMSEYPGWIKLARDNGLLS